MFPYLNCIETISKVPTALFDASNKNTKTQKIS